MNGALNDIRQLITQARQQVQRHINTTMVYTYWRIGKRIVEEEQHGEKRAKYAMEILQDLSKELTAEFGEGFSLTNLKQIRKFFLIYPIQQMPSAKLKNNEIRQSSTDELENNAIGQTPSDQFRDNLIYQSKIDGLPIFPHPRISWSHYIFLMRLKDPAEQDNTQIFASQYALVLPSKEDFIKILRS